MHHADFRFYAELNDFLPAAWRQRTFARNFKGAVSVKHLIEASGVPHTEVEIILVNGISVDFTYLVRPADRVAVFPAFHTVDIAPLVRVRPRWPNPVRFILDSHLGRLARHLRLLGFDTCYRNDYTDLELAAISETEKRILLTRDRALLKRRQVVFGYCLRTRNSKRQLSAVLHRFDLRASIRPWYLCLRCNGRLKPVAKEDIIERLEPLTRRYFHEFRQCQACGRPYWKGSHYSSLQQFIDELCASPVAGHGDGHRSLQSNHGNQTDPRFSWDD